MSVLGIPATTEALMALVSTNISSSTVSQSRATVGSKSEAIIESCLKEKVLDRIVLMHYNHGKKEIMQSMQWISTLDFALTEML